MHQNAPFIPLNIKNRLLKEWGNPPPLLQPPPSRPAAARIGDALSAYSCKISFYSQTYLHPCKWEQISTPTTVLAIIRQGYLLPFTELPSILFSRNFSVFLHKIPCFRVYSVNSDILQS